MELPASTSPPDPTGPDDNTLNDFVDPMTILLREPNKLTARQQAILEFIRVNQPVTNKQISLQFGCAASTVTVHLMFINRSGQIWRSGNKSGARWHADKPFTQPTTPPRVAPPSIEQVASIWHYAQRCARHQAANARAA